VIATDPWTITTMEGVGLLFRQPGSFYQVQGGMCVDVDVLCTAVCTAHRCLYDDSKGKLLADAFNLHMLFPFCLAQV